MSYKNEGKAKWHIVMIKAEFNYIWLHMQMLLIKLEENQLLVLLRFIELDTIGQLRDNAQIFWKILIASFFLRFIGYTT